MILPCLSVRDPWAWAITSRLKPWENRPRRFNYRGPILIHVSKFARAGDYAAAARRIELISGRSPPAFESVQRGVLAGAALLTDCADPLWADDDGWRVAGQFGLRLELGTALPRRPLRGMLGLFKVEITPAEEQTLRAAGLLP